MAKHARADKLDAYQQRGAIILYDVRNQDAAKGFKDNRYAMEDWLINNQSVAVLSPLGTASQYLEGKKYPTSNLVVPSLYGCIELLHTSTAVRQPWDNKLLPSACLRPEVVAARTAVYEDMVLRWKTNMDESLKRYYFVATVCDPRQKAMRFPGMNAGDRASARAWFIA